MLTKKLITNSFSREYRNLELKPELILNKKKVIRIKFDYKIMNRNKPDVIL